MISVLIGLGILSAAIIPLETIWPGVAAQRRLRWDILFGTYYVPDSQPSQFGVADSVPPIWLDSSYGPSNIARASSL